MVFPFLALAVATGFVVLAKLSYEGGVAIADNIVLPTIELSKGIVPSLDILATPFTALFNMVMNWIITPLLVVIFVIAFFVIQYYLIKFYAWIFMKFYQTYLVISQEDVAHFFQHPSVSYANLRKKYEPVTQTTPEVQVDNNIQTQTNTN